jgi:hypothetical protein
MHRFSSQRGAALILLIGIMAALGIIAATLVFVIMNQQQATADDRSRKQSLFAAEAALDSAVQLAKVDNIMSTASEWLTPEELAAAFAGAFPPDADVTFRVYDNLETVNYDIKWDQGGPSSPSTPDGRMWVEATVVYENRTTRTRVLIQQAVKPFADALPKAVTYSDTGITLRDNSDIFALDPESGLPDTSGPPYQTSITAGGTWNPGLPSSWAEVGRFTANSTSDLAAPGTAVQSLGITTNGSVDLKGHPFDNVVVQQGAVGYLSDYFDQAAQTSLADESQAAYPVRASSSGRVIASSRFTPSNLSTSYLTSINASFNAATRTYTFNDNMVVTGDLTLRTSGTPSSGRFPSGTSFKFRSLYLDGSLAVTGQVSLNTTALYVGRDFTISGATTPVTNWLGSVFVKATPTSGIGNVTWSGAASVTSRNYLDPSADPLPMWLGQYWSRTGTYNDEYGPIWVPGNSSTSVVFGSTGASRILCPLLCTTEKTTVSGNVTFGTRDTPMVYFFMCDNNGIYPQVVEWGSTGTYYGLMVINESTIQITNGAATKPSIQGAIFAGCPYDPTNTPGLSKSNIVLEDASNIAYDQYVVGRIATSSLRTTVLVTETVPGSWQQLPVN